MDLNFTCLRINFAKHILCLLLKLTHIYVTGVEDIDIVVDIGYTVVAFNRVTKNKS